MIGLSLSGGGIRGSYQIGAYYAFKKCGIKFDGFVGASIGSLNAAMLASGREKELLKLWRETDFAKVIGLESKFSKTLLKNDKEIKDYGVLLSSFKDIVLNKGLDTKEIRNLLDDLNIEKSLRKSKKDYGLIAVKINKIKPEGVYKYKNDIPKGKLNDYIIGSCHFPIFKLEKLVDDSYYVDGGFYDNSPVNMLLDKGYKKVYSVELNSIGVKQKIKDIDKVVTISPSKSLGQIFTINKNIIRNNIQLGYFDTLKVLKNLDGKRYIFKKHSGLYYKFLTRKVDEDTKIELSKIFNTSDIKLMTIKSIEYVMKQEDFTYFNIYNIIDVVKKVKKLNKEKVSSIYKFIYSLKLL